MHDVLDALKHAQRFQVTQLQIRVLPKYQTLALGGFIRLRHYASIQDESERFEGGESRQIKSALEEILPKHFVVQVKLHPDVQQFKGGAYLFSVTEKFASNAAKQEEIAKLRQLHVIDEHVYVVDKSWADEISGGHSH
ncbi:hypothetical protein HY572_02160 [Candidatus Micrarchaeota archaeon]|nr:hypothetical protein [Candidatus Micrarchaeota archaeon]